MEKKGRCGLCFDSHGVAWDLTEVHQQARLCFRNQVETPELMTSYSWRRLMPTVGHLLQFQPASLAALGDWQEKKDEEPSTKMALRYSSARYQESTRVKHLTLSALSQLQGFEAWEMICPENVEEASRACCESGSSSRRTLGVCTLSCSPMPWQVPSPWQVLRLLWKIWVLIPRVTWQLPWTSCWLTIYEQSAPLCKLLLDPGPRRREERAEWVTRYRESTLPLGQIVKEVFAARDAHWLPMASPTSEGPAVVAAATGGSAPASKAGVTSQFALGKPINGRKVARVMKDGTRLCASFQHGQCKQKSPCPAGRHRCGLVVRGERTCGSPGHGAAACRAASKA